MRNIKKCAEKRNKVLRFKTARAITIQIFLIVFVAIFSVVVAYTSPKRDAKTVRRIESSSSIEKAEKPVVEAPRPLAEEVKVNKATREELEALSNDEDDYLLAKIIMAEVEGCSDKVKQSVARVILNRVHDKRFPNTVKEVIFQSQKGVYQFTPIINGRWDRVEPNADCHAAVQEVRMAQKDISGGALYFESCKNPDNWHSRNLTFLFEENGVRFYK